MSKRTRHRTHLRSALIGVLLLAGLSATAQAAAEGDTSADIIQGCNQFIKFSRKGTTPRDPDRIRRIGECIGAVRATLAFGVKDDDVCPPPQAKLINAITIFSLPVLRHPEELSENYVVVIRRALVDAWPCTSARNL